MKYLVMENHESHSIVMDESGAFHRIANLGYEIGDTVTDPIFMKTPERRKRPNWKKVSTIAAIFVCMLLASVPFINNHNQSDIVVYMSINPEIHLEMDEDGEIKKIVADNDDGKTLLEGYDHRGKNVSSVLIELIDRAERLEFLSEGGNIRITVEAQDNHRARTMSVDLSNVLKNAYVKKYFIQMRVNQEDFHDLDFVLKDKGKEETSVTEDVTEYTESGSRYDATESTYQDEDYDPAVSTQDDTDKGSSKPADTSKPEDNPTKPSINNPTDVTEPATEETTEPAAPTEPSVEDDDDDDDDDDDEDDWVWPWWPQNEK